MRVLLLSLEFLGPVFSGNGTYSRCLVRGLKAAGAVVCVVSGRRGDTPMEQQDAEARGHAQAPHAVVDVPLARWGTVDASSDWRGFAGACGGDARVAAAVAAFAPDVVACVDWHGVLAWRALAGALAASGAPTVAALPAAYLNFRVYSTSSGLAGFAETAPLYRAVEAASVRGCAVTVALCRTDAVALAALALGRDPLTRAPVDAGGCCSPEERAGMERSGLAATVTELLGPGGGGQAAAAPARLPDVRILLPPLRSDVAALASSSSSAAAGAGVPAPAGGDNGCGALAPAAPTHQSPPAARRRRYITSVVRLSPEKGAHRFAELVGALAPTLHRLGLVPLVAGAVGDAAYAERVLAQLRAAAPEAEVVTSFLGPPQLRELFGATALNVHGALSDAYGMTLVEAAAFGAPSVVNVPPGVAAGAGGGGSAGEGGGLLRFVSHSGGHMSVVWGPRALALAAAPGGGGGGAAATAAHSADDGGAGALSLALCALAFPPVGACDLLTPHPPPGGGAPAVVGVDLEAPVEETARTIAALLEGGVSGPLDGEAGPGAGGEGQPQLARIATAARAAATAWSEPDTAAGLRHILRDALGQHAEAR